MHRIHILTAAFALGAGPASAQSNPPAPPPPPPPIAPVPPDHVRMTTPLREHMDLRRGFMTDSAYANRPTLGMTLTTTLSKRDTLGVFVSRVAPGGPAERAGIIEGDRIAAVGDASLTMGAADLDDPYMMGIPAHKLSRAVTKISVGSPVVLKVYANGRYRTVTVTAGRMGDVYKSRERNMMFSLDGDLAPLAEIGPALDRIGPQLERIGPEIEMNIDRAMRSLPRDVHFQFYSDSTRR